MICLNVGRYTIGFFPYWIGISWRYLKCIGRILDFGYIKIVRRPSTRPISGSSDGR